MSRLSTGSGQKAPPAILYARTTARCMCCPTSLRLTGTLKTIYSSLTNAPLLYSRSNSRLSTGGAQKCSLPMMSISTGMEKQMQERTWPQDSTTTRLPYTLNLQKNKAHPQLSKDGYRLSGEANRNL